VVCTGPDFRSRKIKNKNPIRKTFLAVSLSHGNATLFPVMNYFRNSFSKEDSNDGFKVLHRFVCLIYRVLAADQWRALVGQPAEARP
jgi:hypothetical protein